MLQESSHSNKLVEKLVDRRHMKMENLKKSPSPLQKLLIIFILIHLNANYQVNSNVIAQQQASNNNTLPGLSERANGLNSRYLSASGTASLAAATVAAAAAAANQQPQNGANTQVSTNQQQQQNSNINHNNNNQQQQQQQQVNNHHHQQTSIGAQQLAIQQAHSQLPTSVSASSSSSLTNQQQAVNQQLNNQPLSSSVPQQYTPSSNGLVAAPPNGQSSTFPSSSPALSPTPIMSTTYAFNPLTGQIQPIESSTGTTFQFGGTSATPNPFLQQQSSYATANNNPTTVYGYGQSNGGGNYLVSPQSSFIRQQQQQQQRFQSGPFYQVQTNSGLPFNQQQQRLQTNTFVRRNGQLLPQSMGGLNQFRPQSNTIDDDSNGLFQQQQQQLQQSLLLDQQQFNTGNVDPATGYQLVASSVNQQQQAIDSLQQQQQQQPSIGQSVVFPANGVPSTGSFNPAFQNSQNLLLQQQQQSFSTINNNDQCAAADGRHGTCYQASECIKRGGTPMGKCGSSIANSRDELPGSSHVCCLFDISCGQFAAERFVYFRNPGYPSTYDQSRMCRAKIGKLDKGVCQFRLDLLRFDLARPTNGNCSSDMFVVSGQNENYVIPKICGFNDGQHYYVGVDESGVITLHMMMRGFYRRSFEILISQIPCRSDYAAPAHCLQYYMGTHGTIKSFNYDDDLIQFGNNNQATSGSGINYDLQSDGSAPMGAGPVAPYGLLFNGNSNNQQLQQRQQQLISGSSQRYSLAQPESFGGYPNDLDYTICIRKESGFCSITYQMSRSEQGSPSFSVGQENGGLNQMSTECRDDYLLIAGVRLCSGNSNSNNINSAFFDPTASLHSLNGGNNSATNQQLFNQQQNVVQIQQQLQNQQNLLMQQLARIQQQGSSGNNTTNNSNGGSMLFSNGNNNSNIIPGGNQGGGLAQNSNLDQQQAAIWQQIMSIQQQQQQLLSGGGGSGASSSQQSTFSNGQQQFNNRFNQFDAAGGGQYNSLLGDNNGLQGSVITDTTSGPFLLRFVSNMARNARGFHIDYRQNPCK